MGHSSEALLNLHCLFLTVSSNWLETKPLWFHVIVLFSSQISNAEKRLTFRSEAGIVACVSLIKHILPYISDATLLDNLEVRAKYQLFNRNATEMHV